MYFLPARYILCTSRLFFLRTHDESTMPSCYHYHRKLIRCSTGTERVRPVSWIDFVWNVINVAAENRAERGIWPWEKPVARWVDWLVLCICVSQLALTWPCLCESAAGQTAAVSHCVQSSVCVTERLKCGSPLSTLLTCAHSVKLLCRANTRLPTQSLGWRGPSCEQNCLCTRYQSAGCSWIVG